MKDTDTEVLEVAVELQAKDELAADDARAKAAVNEAAVELGVTPEQLERAELAVEYRRRETIVKREQRHRIVRWALGVAVVAGLSVAVWQGLKEPPPTVWSVRFDRQSEWAAEVSTGTLATSGHVIDGEREVTFVHIDHVAPRADGTWIVNLDRHGVPAFAGHTHLSVELSGTLPSARVYLEAGTDERWRSPPIAIKSEWTRHRLALADFEHQRKVDGKWKVVSAADPEGITTLSLKLGHFVNEPTATGLVRVAEITVE